MIRSVFQQAQELARQDRSRDMGRRDTETILACLDHVIPHGGCCAVEDVFSPAELMVAFVNDPAALPSVLSQAHFAPRPVPTGKAPTTPVERAQLEAEMTHLRQRLHEFTRERKRQIGAVCRRAYDSSYDGNLDPATARAFLRQVYGFSEDDFPDLEATDTSTYNRQSPGWRAMIYWTLRFYIEGIGAGWPSLVKFDLTALHSYFQAILRTTPSASIRKQVTQWVVDLTRHDLELAQ